MSHTQKKVKNTKKLSLNEAFDKVMELIQVVLSLRDKSLKNPQGQ